MLLEEVIAPEVEAVVLIGVPCTNGKVNWLLELPIVYNTNHWIERMLLVEHDIATQVEPMLIVVIAILIEGHPCVRCPSQITRRQDETIEQQTGIDVGEFVVILQV